MNKAIVLGFAALAMLAALPVQADHHCTNLRVNVIIGKNSLQVTPADPKCVTPNSVFIIHVVRQGLDTEYPITVRQKDGVPLSIEGNNEGHPNQVVVQVGSGGQPGVAYGYIIDVGGHGMLDPEVRVVDSNLSMLKSILDETNALLEEQMGFSLDELNQKQAEYRELSEQAK